jgi:hypothetical protein
MEETLAEIGDWKAKGEPAWMLRPSENWIKLYEEIWRIYKEEIAK